jgi:hypothetical protein
MAIKYGVERFIATESGPTIRLQTDQYGPRLWVNGRISNGTGVRLTVEELSKIVDCQDGDTVVSEALILRRNTNHPDGDGASLRVRGQTALMG